MRSGRLILKADLKMESFEAAMCHSDWSSHSKAALVFFIMSIASQVTKPSI